MDKLGLEHVNVVESYHNLASIYEALCDLEQAKQYKQREKLGPEHDFYTFKSAGPGSSKDC